MNDVKKLTDIDLSELQLGERLTIYRGSAAFLTGPQAAGYVGDAIVTGVKRKSAILYLEPEGRPRRIYRLRFKDARICRVPNGEPTMLYVHARGGRPTVTAYFTDAEYALVKVLLSEELIPAPAIIAGFANAHAVRRSRTARAALDRMEFHDNLRSNGGRSQ